jgi:hypothetical protein
MTTVIYNAWGDLGRALYDVPDIELAALGDRLRAAAAAEPGRLAAVLLAVAGMVETEREMRQRAMARRPA